MPDLCNLFNFGNNVDLPPSFTQNEVKLIIACIHLVFYYLTCVFSSSLCSGWVGSLANGLYFLCCPLTSMLLRRLSCRAVILVGVVLYSTGLLTTSFITALEYAYLTFGLLVGIGANFAIYGSNYLLLKWFRERNFIRVNSITSLGTSFGMYTKFSSFPVCFGLTLLCP